MQNEGTAEGRKERRVADKKTTRNAGPAYLAGGQAGGSPYRDRLSIIGKRGMSCSGQGLIHGPPDSPLHALISLSLGAIQVEPGRCMSHHQIATVASEAKRLAKKIRNNSLRIKRRREAAHRTTSKLPRPSGRRA